MILNYQINKKRLWNSLMELGEFGKGQSGGVTRLSLSVEDVKAREYITKKMKEAGLSVRVDAVGNIFGRFEGTDRESPVILVGSHIDTVINGGKFDGPLGVLGAIEAVRTIKEHNIKLTHPIEVVSFTDEEGIRFNKGFIGSNGVVGNLTKADFQLLDVEGISYVSAYHKLGYNPEDFSTAIRRSAEIKAYIEMHIEQGRVLETEGLAVGIVTDIQGPVWMDVTLKGQADHAGATPMEIRKDPSLAMAEVLSQIEKIAIKHEGVASVGTMKFLPNAANVIPEEVSFCIDFRHINKKIREKMKEEIVFAINKSADKRLLKAEWRITEEEDPASCSANIIEVIKEASEKINLPIFKMKCGAGHDSLIMSQITDIGMIFVRSKDGISHNPLEWSSPEDCEKGTLLLLQTLILLAK